MGTDWLSIVNKVFLCVPALSFCTPSTPTQYIQFPVLLILSATSLGLVRFGFVFEPDSKRGGELTILRHVIGVQEIAQAGVCLLVPASESRSPLFKRRVTRQTTVLLFIPPSFVVHTSHTAICLLCCHWNLQRAPESMCHGESRSYNESGFRFLVFVWLSNVCPGFRGHAVVINLCGFMETWITWHTPLMKVLPTISNP